MIDFDFTPEQFALRDAARELFARAFPPARLRARWDGESRDNTLWRSMAEMGLLGLGIPTEFGGGGGDETDMVLVLEELGRAGVAEPYLETVAVAAPLIAESGTYAQWLPRIASGDAVVAVALADEPFVLDADIADLFLVERDGAVHACVRGTFEARAVRSMDGARRVFSLQATPGIVLTKDDAVIARAHERAAAATAAVLNGVGLALLAMSVEHAKTRVQFGRPIGAFQAVKHMLASASVALEAARGTAWYAAYARARALPEATIAAAVAKAAAADAGAMMNTAALQVHGGIGFTWEHDLHRWLTRGKVLEGAYGTAAQHRARIAAHLIEEMS